MELDYSKAVNLDAEGLAEGGIGSAYEDLLPELKRYVGAPAAVEETDDDDGYRVRSGGVEHVIYSPALPSPRNESWGRATVAFFDIVNRQMAAAGTPVRFWALNGGNDLFGIFLTSDEVERAKPSLSRRKDWPYLPVNGDKWYGQPH